MAFTAFRSGLERSRICLSEPAELRRSGPPTVLSAAKTFTRTNSLISTAAASVTESPTSPSIELESADRSNGASSPGKSQNFSQVCEYDKVPVRSWQAPLVLEGRRKVLCLIDIYSCRNANLSALVRLAAPSPSFASRGSVASHQE